MAKVADSTRLLMPRSRSPKSSRDDRSGGNAPRSEATIRALDPDIIAPACSHADRSHVDRIIEIEIFLARIGSIRSGDGENENAPGRMGEGIEIAQFPRTLLRLGGIRRMQIEQRPALPHPPSDLLGGRPRYGGTI